jgi:hypothetical protein
MKNMKNSVHHEVMKESSSPRTPAGKPGLENATVSDERRPARRARAAGGRTVDRKTRE